MKLIDTVGRKFQNQYFKGSMFIRGALELPAQTRKDIRLFRTIFDHFRNRRITVFEWGGGFSTLFYGQYLKSRDEGFEWHAIENNRGWYDKILAKIRKKGLDQYVWLHLKEFPPFWEKEGWRWENIPPPRGVFSPKSENEKEYITFPKQLNKKFDVIIIDARFRRHCLEVAREALSDNGVVILHDAQKTHYHAGLENFKYGKFIDTGEWYPFQEKPNQMWVGTMHNQSLLNILN